MTWLNDYTGTSVESHEPLQLAPKYLLKKVTTYVNLFSWMFLLRPWTFHLLQKWKSTCSSFCLAEYQQSMRGVFSWHMQHACATWMNIGSDLNTCVLNYVSGTWYRDLHFWPISELQGFKCWAVFVKGTMNSPKRRPSRQVISHDKYNCYDASLHFKCTRGW